MLVNALIISALPMVVKAYHLSAHTAQITEQILIFHGAMAMLIWPIAFVLPATFRAAGDVKVCMVIAIVSMWIFRIAFSYVLGGYLGWGVFGVWVAMVIDWIFRAICFTIRYFGGKWQKAAVV